MLCRVQHGPCGSTRGCCTAVDMLLAVGALAVDDVGPPRLTGLGSHLAALPMDIHVAKMLVYACMLHCVSPVLTIAAAMAYGRPMFVAPSDKRAEVALILTACI